MSPRRRTPRGLALAVALAASSATPAHASLFEGETLDKVANVLAWVVLVIAPAIGIAVFWLVHILPEKYAEKVHHPQTKAIQVLCLLSLVFGGLLWPLAWLWAYSKPVFYRMAYGEDRVEHGAGGHEAAAPAPAESREITKPGIADAAEMTLLRSRIARLERELDRRGSERGE